MGKESTVHGHSWHRRLVLQILVGIFCFALAANRHVHVLVLMFLFVCREDGHLSFSLASPPRLRSHLCPSVSVDLTPARSAWENCTTARHKGSHTHFSGPATHWNCACFSTGWRKSGSAGFFRDDGILKPSKNRVEGHCARQPCLTPLAIRNCPCFFLQIRLV